MCRDIIFKFACAQSKTRERWGRGPGCAQQKRSGLIFPFDCIIASVGILNANRKPSGNNKELLGRKAMQQEVKIEWEMGLPEDESENGRNTGSWTTHENLLYAIFISQNKSTMVSKRKRKNLRVFDRMADFILSRNSLQCRSHHQKLIEKFTEIKNIINIFKKFFGAQYFKEQSQLYAKQKPSAIGQQAKTQYNINTPTTPNSPQEEEKAEGGSEQKPEEGSREESEIKIPEAIRPEIVRVGGGCMSECKAEEQLEYYYPINYYLGNCLLQFPFFNGLYPTSPYQSA